ncbi:uncharacterized protein LOC8075917 isoform X1 [Sorghum bicolor]|uniref:C2 domain-containing protein n=1 Tax=Sorghum bicolor TaxID=4558 RepID=A0A1B6PLZ0_SORBI|nr:uncharacterized protein LOC8075917 isoform X1 [Sorghum bicolor]KXG26688.1 hypothetical protein SORBI_3006G142600 [Sorghum bicolor]|eukprot:XP_021318363.1 uncharacterized protein LOC8075917 isoform X1 [Sorghum bicolor]
MASTSAPAVACRVAPARATTSVLPAHSLPGCRAAVVWRCWAARRGRRRRWAGLRARCRISCEGSQPSAVQPDSESSGEGLVAEEDGPRRPPFDINLAVVLAGFAFEAYTSPPADVGWRETDAADCQTVFLSDVFLREVYDGQLVVRLKKGINLPAMDPWGTSDPYVILQLNGQTAKSQIKWATKDPTWNEDFTFNIKKSRENLLQVAAWDANLVTPHKRMGNAGLYLESLCDGNNHGVSVELEGLGGGGTIEIEVKYKSYEDIEREKQWWRIPFVSDFLVKSSLGSALRMVLGSESINASQFVKSAFGQLNSFTYTYLPKPSSLESGAEVSKNDEESSDGPTNSNELQQQNIDSEDISADSHSHSEARSPAATVNSEGDASSDMKESDEYFWRALNNVLNQNVLQNFGFSLPEVKQLDGFDLLSSLGLKSREIAEQEYLESGLAMADTSTSDGSETTPENTVGVENENGTLTTKEEVQSSFPDINKVSRDVLSQTENILGALMILSKNLSPHDQSVTTTETNGKDDMIREQQGASAADSVQKDDTVASTILSIDAQKAEDMRSLFASAETAMEAWAMLATSLGRNSFIKSDFEKICFLDNVSTDTQVAIWRDSSRRRLVVAFRGTEQSRWKDLRTDLMLVPAGLNPERLGGDFKQEVQVHSGFLGAYDSVRNRIMTLIKYAVGFLDEEDAGTIPSWHVYVTGHSLGGALATLLALELSSSQMAKNGVIFVTMYNFGSPRVGNRRFAEVYNAKVKDSWRIVNHRDIIPTVPRLMGYCHVEAPVYLKFGDAKDSPVNNNILDDEDQGDVIGEYTPDVLVTEFMKGEKQLVEKLLQTEINLLRSIRDGSALMQHMEDFYYVTLLENVKSRYQVVDGANDEYRQLTA